MQCTNPDNYSRHGIYLSHKPPCGKCLPCRISRQSEWASRLLLESKLHDSATFWTLTYSDDHLKPELSKPDMQKFVKRWNNKYGQPRYFLCGEYGDLTTRPHYHGIFFGDKPEFTWSRAKHSSGATMLIKADQRYEETWGKGITHVRESTSSEQTKNIMRYVAAYVVKKNLRDPDELPSKEWALMSRTPYIGSGSVNKIVDALTTKSGSKHLAISGTCPGTFRMGGKQWLVPLRIRKEVCAALDCDFLHYQPTTGEIVIDESGYEVLKSKHVIKKTKAEADRSETRLRNAFKSKKLRAKSRAGNSPAALYAV